AGWFGGHELYVLKVSATAKSQPSLVEGITKPPQPLHHIALSPDGSILYGAGRTEAKGSSPSRWVISRTRLKGKGAGGATGAPLTPLDTSNRPNSDEVHALTLRPDGEVLAAAMGDALILWDTRSGEQIDTHRGSTLSMCAFAVGSEEGRSTIV